MFSLTISDFKLVNHISNKYVAQLSYSIFHLMGTLYFASISFFAKSLYVGLLNAPLGTTKCSLFHDNVLKSIFCAQTNLIFRSKIQLNEVSVIISGFWIS